MKWKTVKPVPKHGEIRKRNKFAWRPTEVEDYTVWLEFYQITEMRIEYDKRYDIPGSWDLLSKELLYPYY
jgi:hypothetical protein